MCLNHLISINNWINKHTYLRGGLKQTLKFKRELKSLKYFTISSDFVRLRLTFTETHSAFKRFKWLGYMFVLNKRIERQPKKTFVKIFK